MDEQKTYAPGTVTISAEEYRDLVQSLTKAQEDAQHANSERWKVSREHTDALKQLEAQKKQYEELRGFVNSDEVIKANLRAYRLEQRMLNDEQGECS